MEQPPQPKTIEEIERRLQELEREQQLDAEALEAHGAGPARSEDSAIPSIFLNNL